MLSSFNKSQNNKITQENFKVIIRVRPLQAKQTEQIAIYEQAQAKRFKNPSNKMIKLSPNAYSFYSKFYNIANVNQVINLDHNTVYVIDPQYKNTEKKMKPYVFSDVYGPTETSKELFDQSLSNQINCVFEGYNYTILAYGITGSGKTHTVFGQNGRKASNNGNSNGHGPISSTLPSSETLFPQSISQSRVASSGISTLVFSQLINKKLQIQESSNSDVTVNLKFSFVQIYNENARDLLSQDCKYVNIVEDSKGTTSFNDATNITITNHEQIDELIELGLSKRSSGATAANQYSSRSHAILQLNVEVISENGSKVTAKIFIIDLAGSEKLQSLNSAKKMQQGANINKSLLALGNCINTLAQNSKKGLSSSLSHIPYRDSKLTRILKDSLGGNAKTLMISCISPNPFTIQETITTLNYAQRAQGIKKNIKKNKDQDNGINSSTSPGICQICQNQFYQQKRSHSHSKHINTNTLNINNQAIDLSNIKIPPSLLEDNFQRQQAYQQLFDQIYDDIIQNVKQGEAIERILNASGSGSGSGTSRGRDSSRSVASADVQKLKFVNSSQQAELKQTLMKLFYKRKLEYGQKLTELKIFVEGIGKGNRFTQQMELDRSRRKTMQVIKKSNSCSRIKSTKMRSSNIQTNQNYASTSRIFEQKHSVPMKSQSLQRKPLAQKQDFGNGKLNATIDSRNKSQTPSANFESIKFLLPEKQQRSIKPATGLQFDQNRFSFASLLENTEGKENMPVQGTNLDTSSKLQQSGQGMTTKRKRSKGRFQVVKKMSASKVQAKQFSISSGNNGQAQ